MLRGQVRAVHTDIPTHWHRPSACSLCAHGLLYTQACPQPHRHTGVWMCIHLCRHMHTRVCDGCRKEYGTGHAHPHRLSHSSACSPQGPSQRSLAFSTDTNHTARKNLVLWPRKGVCALKPHHTTPCSFVAKSCAECPGATKEAVTLERGAASETPPEGVAGDAGFAVGEGGTYFKVCPRVIQSCLYPVSLSANKVL